MQEEKMEKKASSGMHLNIREDRKRKLQETGIEHQPGPQEEEDAEPISQSLVDLRSQNITSLETS